MQQNPEQSDGDQYRLAKRCTDFAGIAVPEIVVRVKTFRLMKQNNCLN
jgi:hypothetical protein